MSDYIYIQDDDISYIIIHEILWVIIYAFEDDDILYIIIHEISWVIIYASKIITFYVL